MGWPWGWEGAKSSGVQPNDSRVEFLSSLTLDSVSSDYVVYFIFFWGGGKLRTKIERKLANPDLPGKLSLKGGRLIISLLPRLCHFVCFSIILHLWVILYYNLLVSRMSVCVSFRPSVHFTVLLACYQKWRIKTKKMSGAQMSQCN